MIDGIEYSSINQAAKSLKCHESKIKKMCVFLKKK